MWICRWVCWSCVCVWQWGQFEHVPQQCKAIFDCVTSIAQDNQYIHNRAEEVRQKDYRKHVSWGLWVEGGQCSRYYWTDYCQTAKILNSCSVQLWPSVQLHTSVRTGVQIVPQGRTNQRQRYSADGATPFRCHLTEETSRLGNLTHIIIRSIIQRTLIKKTHKEAKKEIA